MSESGHIAYVTGGASGIGHALVTMLVGKGAKVCIADCNIRDAQRFADELNKNGQHVACAVEVDVADWESQAKGFETALTAFGGRVDYVFPVAGVTEYVWTKNDPGATQGFTKPNQTTIDVNLHGLLYTCSLAIQQFRRQEPNRYGYRGKIGAVASVCGFYCISTLPIYTASKHGVVGFVRTYGKWLPREKITLNAVCPNVTRTGISTDVFYQQVEDRGLVAPMSALMDAFESFLGASDVSGECFEAPPNGGFYRRAPAEWLNKESEELLMMTYDRSIPLHMPINS